MTSHTAVALSVSMGERYLQVREERRGLPPPVVQPIDVGDGNLRQLFLRDAFQAAHVDTVHLADRRLVADAEGAHATTPAEEVLILAGIEKVLGELLLTRNQPKALRPGDRDPEAVSPANGAVAPVGALRAVEIRLESHRAAVAAPLLEF